jgi:hypothetical protein
MFIEIRQDIEVDVVRLERIGVLFEIVLVQPVAKIAHAEKFQSPSEGVESTTFPGNVCQSGICLSKTRMSGLRSLAPDQRCALNVGLYF